MGPTRIRMNFALLLNKLLYFVLYSKEKVTEDDIVLRGKPTNVIKRDYSTKQTIIIGK